MIPTPPQPQSTPAERARTLRETLKHMPEDNLRTEEDALITQLQEVQETLPLYLIERLCREALRLEPAATAVIFSCSEHEEHIFGGKPDIQIRDERYSWHEAADRARSRTDPPDEGLLVEGFDESDMRDLSDDFRPIGVLTELTIDTVKRSVTVGQLAEERVIKRLVDTLRSVAPAATKAMFTTISDGDGFFFDDHPDIHDGSSVYPWEAIVEAAMYEREEVIEDNYTLDNQVLSVLCQLYAPLGENTTLTIDLVTGEAEIEYEEDAGTCHD